MRVVQRGELDAGRRPSGAPRQSGVCLTTMLPNSLGIGEPPERLHGHLEGARLLHRRLVEHARRDLHVLALQRGDDVAGGQAERLQPVGIEPDAHRIVAAAEHGDRADAVDAGQDVDDARFA